MTQTTPIDIMRLGALVVGIAFVAAHSTSLESRREPAAVVTPCGAMPLDLVVSRRTIANERGDLSPNGKWVAYTLRSPSAERGTDQRWLPGGVPGNAAGKEVVVAHTSTGQFRSIGPPGRPCWRPRFSPDGKQLAFYCAGEGAVRLWLYDVKSGTSRQVGNAVVKAKLWAGDEPIWNPAGTEVFVPLMGENERASNNVPEFRARGDRVDHTVHRSGNEVTPSTATESRASQQAIENGAALAAIRLATGDVRIAVPATAHPQPSLLRLSPTGTWLGYLSVSGSEYAVVPTAGGPVRLVTSRLHGNRAAGFALTAYAWHPTRDELFWIQDHQLWTMNFASGDPVAMRLAPDHSDVTVGPLVFTRDGRFALIGVNPVDIDDFRNPSPRSIVVVPLDGGSPTLLELPEGLNLHAFVLQQGSTLWQPESPTLATLIGEDPVTARRVVLRLDLHSGKTAILWQGFANIQLWGASADGQVMVGTFEDLNTPSDVYRFDQDILRGMRLSDVEPRLKAVCPSRVETFQTLIRKPDGTPLERTTTTVLLPPAPMRDQRLPTLVAQYPGLRLSLRAGAWGGGTAAISIPLALFTTRGYAVLLVDAPFGEFDSAHEPAREVVDVVMPQVRRAIDLGYTDSERVAVIGHSAGGYSTAAIVSTSSFFRAAVAISGFYDLSGWYVPETVIHRRIEADPWTDITPYLANSPYYRANAIRTPLLLLHGEDDRACPVDEARKLFGALRHFDRTVQLATYPGEGHVPAEWSLVNAVDASRRMLDFLAKYLRSS